MGVNLVNGHVMKSARSLRNMTQKELGEKIGVTYNYIIELEKDRKVATDKLKTKLSVVLDIPIILLYVDQIAGEGIERGSELGGAIENAIDIAINIMYNK